MHALSGAVPPTGLVLLAIGSTQVGAALAKGLFAELGPAGTVLLRVAFAAAVLVVLWRPRVAGLTRGDLLLAAVFGLALAAMNLSFYAALERIPLGVAVTVEFVGPLGVAVAFSRRRSHFLWVGLATAGLLLLADPGGSGLDPVGIGLALVAGAFWAAYILLSARAGRAFPGGTGLALAMAFGAVLLVPVGIADGGGALLQPELLLIGAGVAMLSSAIPYSLELEALRRLPARTFGILMSVEPAVAATAGWIVLGERLGGREWLAIALVVTASAGATREGRAPAPPEP